MHGVTRWRSLSISAKTGAPIRDMMRMLTTTYAESVSSTPICEMGEPTGPMEKGRTYMVRPRMEPLKSCFIRLRMTKGSSQQVEKQCFIRLRMTKGSSQLLVGPALSLEREQMKVRSSTRATSVGTDRA